MDFCTKIKEDNKIKLFKSKKSFFVPLLKWIEKFKLFEKTQAFFLYYHQTIFLNIKYSNSNGKEKKKNSILDFEFKFKLQNHQLCSSGLSGFQLIQCY